MATNKSTPNRQIAVTFACLILAASALFLGARDPIGRNLVITGAGIFGTLTWWSTGETTATRPSDPAVRGTFLAMSALPLLCLVQFIGVLFFDWSPVAVIDHAEFAALIVAYELLLLGLLKSTSATKNTSTIVAFLIALGICEASYGVLNLLTGNTYLLVFRRWTDDAAATGTLVSKNHFAYLLEMTIPFGLAMLVSMWERSRPGAGQGIEARARTALLGAGVATMVLGLLLSRSRMGLVSLAAAAAIVATLSYLLKPVRQPGTRPPNDRTPLLLVGLATFALLAGIGIDAAFERFARAGADLESGRLPIWRETWSMIRESPILGHGFGSYPGLIGQYRRGPTGLAFAHAHSDYLEVLAEGGIVGLSIVGSWLFLFARRLRRSLLLTVDPEKRRRIVAAAVAIFSVALHSTVDFGLRIPAVSIALIFVVAIFVRTTQPLSAGQRPSETVTP